MSAFSQALHVLFSKAAGALLHLKPKLLVGVALAVIILVELRKGYFRRVKTARKPFSFKPFTVIFLSGAALTLLTLPFDPLLLGKIQSLKGPLPEGVIDFGAWVGRNVNFWVVLIGFYLLGFLARRRGVCQNVFGALLSSALTGLVCHALKFVFLRARPYAGLGPFSFFHLEGLTHDARPFQSFPSGDAAIVAGAASFLFYAIPNRSLRWFVFLLPLATALARVSINKHWPSDTVGSLAIGLMVAHLVWDYKKRTSLQL